MIKAYPRKWMIALFMNKLQHIFEQVEWRTLQVAEKSPECILNAECKICKCKIPDLFYADKGCSNKQSPCYPELMSKNKWTTFKNKQSYANIQSNTGEPESQTD